MKRLCLDEFHTITQPHRQSEAIIERLRDIPDIPQVRYQVIADKVFVFDKLIYLIKNDAIPLEAINSNTVAPFLAKAWVTPYEAVTEWKIIPIPYTIREAPSHLWEIRHTAFNASMPILFESKTAVDQALALLLVGDTINGAGDFCFEGQPLKLVQPLSPHKLPPRPIISGNEGSHHSRFPILSTIEFRTEFPPINEKDFQELQQLELLWANSLEHIDDVLYRTPDQVVWNLWPAQITEEQLLNAAVDIPADKLNAVELLRKMYPQLHQLTDRALYTLYDNYQDSHDFHSWKEPTVDKDFLFYLLGQSQHDSAELTHVGTRFSGRLQLFALLQGKNYSAAVTFMKTCSLYHRTILGVAHTILQAYSFIEYRNKYPNMGFPVTTQSDLFKNSRAKESKLMYVQQALKDFS